MSDDGNDTNNIHVDTPDEPVLTPPIETVNHNITSTLKRKMKMQMIMKAMNNRQTVIRAMIPSIHHRSKESH